MGDRNKNKNKRKTFLVSLPNFFSLLLKTVSVLRKYPTSRRSKMNYKPVVLLLAMVLLSAEAKPNAVERLMSDGDLVEALSKYVNEIEERMDGFDTKLNSTNDKVTELDSSFESMNKEVTELKGQPKFRCEWNWLHVPTTSTSIYFSRAFTKPPTFLAALASVTTTAGSSKLALIYSQPTSKTAATISGIATNSGGAVHWMACGY